MRVDEELRKAHDAQMVRQTLAGKTNAFSVLYDQCKDILIFSVFNKINNWHDAQDIAHDAFLKAFEHLEELRKLEKFSGWLFKIAAQRFSRTKNPTLKKF